VTRQNKIDRGGEVAKRVEQGAVKVEQDGAVSEVFGGN